MTTLFDHPNYVAPEQKTITEEQAAYALREAWKRIYGYYPSLNSLAVIWAKTCLETGHFKVGFWNYNFGNIKRKNDDELFTMFRCSEILNGKEVFFDPPHPQTAFRAYLTIEDGAENYLKFVSKRTAAWQKVIEGDPKGYAHELKLARYYTASEEKYTNTLVGLFNTFLKNKDKLLSWVPPEEDNKDTDPAPPPSFFPEDKTHDTDPDLEKPIEEVTKPTAPGKKDKNLFAIIGTIVVTLLGLFGSGHC
jgi:hypothetical protein